MDNYLQSADGTRIHYQMWQPQAQKEVKGALVISHGHSEYGARYEACAQRFAQEGLAVYALDYRGHGNSGGKIGHVSAFEDYADDLDGLVEIAKAQQGTKPLFLLGHSMGGLIACDYFLRHRKKLNALILSAPSLKLKIKTAFAERIGCAVMSLLKPDFVLPRTINPYDLARDKKVVSDYLSDPLIHRKISARLYTEMVGYARSVMRRTSEFDIPTLLLAGGEDKIASAETIKEFYEKIPAKIKALKVYPAAYHELLNDLGKEQVMNDILSWLRPFFLDTPKGVG